MKKVIWFGLFFLLSWIVQGQTTGSVVIQEIQIEGNKKTKDKIILRELDFSLGDSMSMTDLMPRLQRNKLLLLNTGLFNQVELNISKWNGKQVNVLIKVTEDWYILPIPIFELADRNFNVWWVEQERSFKRVNYGMRLYHRNLTGRNDLWKLKLQFGYTPKYELEYRLPFFNKKQTLGIGGHVFYSTNKELNLRTAENKLDFFRYNDEVLLTRKRAGLSLIFRPELLLQHEFFVEYADNNIHEEILARNSNYFLKAQTRQQFFSLKYNFNWDKRDFRPYPKEGFRISALVKKEGLGIFDDRNQLSSEIRFAKHFKLNNKFHVSLIQQGLWNILNNRPSYYQNRALGYEETYLRGYEYYVLDGQHYVFQKSSLHYEIINKEFDFSKYMPIGAFKVLPLKIYAVINNDVGYVWDKFYFENNPLVNDWQWGGGIGLDFVFYQNVVIQWEYSLNKLREHDLYLHFKYNL